MARKRTEKEASPPDASPEAAPAVPSPPEPPAPPQPGKILRRKTHGNLVNFACAIDVPGRPMSADPDEWLFAKVETTLAPHHRLLLEKIEQVVNTPYGRAMILMPPGSAKSTYCSVVLPTFLMGREPGYRIILASYGIELARKHGRRARQIVRSE